MSEKVILILVDGMRPDGMMGCGNPFAEKLIKESTYSLTAQTVMPSVTLPCHMSLFHSVDPERHGILTNTYVPQVRPIEGLFDRLDKFDKKCKEAPSGIVFEIRENVRKGKYTNNRMSVETEELLLENGVPEWYVESMKKIRYLASKSHLVSKLKREIEEFVKLTNL